MSELKVSYGANTSVTAKLDEFPFRVEFSLAPLISYWEREIADGHSVLGKSPGLSSSGSAGPLS